jgi:hypothetical protein
MQMKSSFNVRVMAVSVASAILLAACGGAPAPVSVADLPTYAGASQLQPGNSPIATTLKNNEQQAAATGQKIEQKAFSLPKDATWDKLIAFYGNELKAKGWKEGAAAGGLGSGMANDMVKNALNQANAANDGFKTAIFTRGKQTLTLMRMAGASKKDEVQLLLSLNTNP